jgi:hypothetical protein
MEEAQQQENGQQMDAWAQLQELRGVVQAQQAMIQHLATQPPSTSNSNSARPIKPSTYNGSIKANVELWVFEMEQYFKVTRMPATEQVDFAISFLRDVALIWAREWSSSEAHSSSWSEFKQQLFTRFRPVEATKTARAVLKTLKQRGSVSDYCSHFSRILQSVTNMSMEDRIDRFIDGLNANIADEVERMCPNSLEQAMSIAQRTDLRLQRRRQTQTPFSSRFPRHSGAQHASKWQAPPPGPRAGPVPMELGQLQDTQSEDQEDLNFHAAAINRVPNLSRAEYDQLVREGKCLRCRQPGHLARNCPRLILQSKNVRAQ